jgi:hypothetical protein
MLIPAEAVYVIGSGVMRPAYQTLFFWETRNWHALEGEHFIIKYQDGDQENARLVLEEAERFYKPLGEYFSYFPEKKTPVAIYRDKPALNKVFGWGNDVGAMGVYWGGVIRLLSPDDWLGEYSGDEKEDAFRRQGPMAHEYIHLLVDYKTRGNYPRWLTEGLAQYGEKHCAGVDIAAAAGEEQTAVLEFSLADLDKKFDDPQSQEYSYAVAEDLVNFMIQEYGAGCISPLLEELSKGEDADRAMEQALGINLQNLLKEYQRAV